MTDWHRCTFCSLNYWRDPIDAWPFGKILPPPRIDAPGSVTADPIAAAIWTACLFVLTHWKRFSEKQNELSLFSRNRSIYCWWFLLLGLQAMDLRWGIREQSHDDHTIIEFCMREIENCKRASVGPTFIVSSLLFHITYMCKLKFCQFVCRLRAGKVNEGFR